MQPKLPITIPNIQEPILQTSKKQVLTTSKLAQVQMSIPLLFFSCRKGTFSLLNEQQGKQERCACRLLNKGVLQSLKPKYTFLISLFAISLILDKVTINFQWNILFQNWTFHLCIYSLFSSRLKDQYPYQLRFSVVSQFLLTREGVESVSGTTVAHNAV